MTTYLPDTAAKLASWAKKAREATLNRDFLIRQMDSEGASLRTIGEAAGLSHTAIRKILARSTTPAMPANG